MCCSKNSSAVCRFSWKHWIRALNCVVNVVVHKNNISRYCTHSIFVRLIFLSFFLDVEVKQQKERKEQEINDEKKQKRSIEIYQPQKQNWRSKVAQTGSNAIDVVEIGAKISTNQIWKQGEKWTKSRHVKRRIQAKELNENIVLIITATTIFKPKRSAYSNNKTATNF